MYDNKYSTLMYHAEYFHCSKNLCSTYSSLHPSPLSLPTTDLFTVSIALTLPKCHIVGIIQYTAFAEWFLSFPNAHLRFLLVFLWFDSSFLFAAKSHQSYPTLCDLIDGSPPGSPVPGILQAKTLE